MQCAICGREAYYYSEYLKQWLCKKHFEKMIVRRIRRNIINNGFYSKEYRILDSTEASKLLRLLFKEGNGPILDTYTLEDFAEEVLEYLLLNKEPKIKVKDKNYFNPLYNSAREEIIAFAKLKNLEIKFEENPKLLNFINELEKRRPGSKISIVNSALSLGII